MASDLGSDRAESITGVMELLEPKEVAALHRATLGLLGLRARDELCLRLVDEAIRLTRGSFSYVMLAAPGEALAVAASKGLVAPSDRDAVAERVVETRTAELVTSGIELGESLAGTGPTPRSLAYVPLALQGRCLGALCVGAYRRELSAKELAQLGLLGPPAAHVLDGMRLYEESTSLSAKLGLVLELQQLLARGPLMDTFRRFAGALHAVIPFDLALLLVHEADQRELVIAHAWGRAGGAAWPGRRVRVDASLHAQGLARRRPAVIDSLAESRAGEDARWLREAGVASGLVLPLVSFDASVGIFSLWSEHAEAFGPEQLAQVEGLGQPLALAVENSRLFNRVEQAKREWEATFDAMNDAVCIVDAAGRVQRFNAAFRRALGLGNEDLLDALLADLLGIDTDILAFTDDEAIAGRVFREIRGTALGLLAEVVGTRLRGPAWADVGTVFVARDVTATKELNARLQEADRLAAIGQLAAAVAHEINNPLAYILSNLHSVSEHVGAFTKLVQRADRGDFGESCAEVVRTQRLRAAVDELPAVTGETLSGVLRLQRIVQKLQLYTRFEAPGLGRVSLNELLDFCLTLVWARLSPRAQVVYGYGDVPPIQVNIGALTQTLVNLLVSAAESLDQTAVESNVLEVSTAFGDGAHTISIQARGTPLPKPSRAADVRKTRPVANEAQLALASSVELLRELGGEVEIIVDAGGVTSFEVTLSGAAPRPGSDQPRPSRVPDRASPRRRGRVMVVDDELYVRRALSRILRGHHDVELAGDAGTALAAIRSGASFDVILCDVVMPGMSGIAFHEALAAERPDLADAVVFVTGGVFTPEAEEAMRAGPNPIMRKPVEPADLLDMVASVMARRAGA